MTKTITNEEYSSILQNATKPVVLDFEADW